MKIFDLDAFLTNVQKEEDAAVVDYKGMPLIGSPEYLTPEFLQAFRLLENFMGTELSDCNVTLDELALVVDHVSDIEDFMTSNRTPGFSGIWSRIGRCKSLGRRVL